MAAAFDAALAKHPSLGLVYKYGTAGFRTKADILDPVLFRVGMLATLRSKFKGGATIGIMITASHNPECDNGAKVVDPLGEMLEGSWEAYATRLANCADAELTATFEAVAKEVGVDMSAASKVAVARDTRASGVSLTEAAVDACAALGADCTDYGVLTTPQLHYIVRCINDPSYGTPTEDGYHEKISGAFARLHAASGAKGPSCVKVDCANGVGAQQFARLAARIPDALQVTLFNTGDGGLNEQCGADYVKLYQKAPAGMDITDGDKCAVFDGDADRVLYFYTKEGEFVMLDGDRLSGLFALFIRFLADNCGLDLNIGCVQTAYANGNSTTYLEQVAGVPVACAKTGVKHLHHLAQDFDVGVYFEANGHGTVLFSDRSMAQIASAVPKDDNAKKYLAIFRDVLDVINQTVGDAISDLLLVEAILLFKDWTVEEWGTAYADLPNRQLKVKIADRTIVKTTNAERQVTSPDGLQAAVDALVAPVESGRSFVRPSGTEDVVRVYAEAATRDACDELAYAVARKVYELAGGVGEPPADPAALKRKREG